MFYLNDTNQYISFKVISNSDFSLKINVPWIKIYSMNKSELESEVTLFVDKNSKIHPRKTLIKVMNKNNEDDVTIYQLGFKSNFVGGICFTFDDFNVEEWLNMYTYLKKYYQWEGTFFIRTNLLNQDFADSLFKLQDNNNNEIGCHTRDHPDFNDYIKKYGIESWFNNEVIASKHDLEKYGFIVSSFAYPSGEYNDKANELTTNEFNSVRGTCYGEIEPSRQRCFYYPSDYKRLIHGIGIDISYGLSMKYIFSLLDHAIKNQACVIFYGHKVGPELNNESYKTTYSRLDSICSYAVEHSMSFLKISDL